MGYIDTDTHVIDPDECWDYLDPSERDLRPVVVEIAPTAPGLPPKQMYLIGETLCRRFPTDGRAGGFGAEYTPEVSHLRDPSVRLRKMDALGIDVQIIISTNFIAAEIDNPLHEAAIMRSWNRWAAQATAPGKGRLPWVLVCPTRTVERAIEELEFGARNGACGVMMKGVEHGLFLSDPYFHPIYQKAEELNLSIVVHQGAARHHIEGLGITRRPASMAHNLHYAATVMQAFYAVLESDLYKRFPRLRFCFVESGAEWAPFVFHHFQRMRAARNPESFTRTSRGPSRIITPMDPKEEMARRNTYISCETDEHLPHLVSLLGEDHITVGTDMCHNDNGSDPLAHTVLMEREDLDKRVARKIVDTNGRRAFGLPMDFRPTDSLKPEDVRDVDLAVL